MGQSYFIFNGRDCREMGVRLTSPLELVRPEERVEHIQIPGRAGDLTRLEGDDVYNSYIHTAEISVQGELNVLNAFNWLKGSGYMTTSSEPDRRQMARVIGAITLAKLSKNLDIWKGQVQFYCQPLKELLWEPTQTLTAAGTITNNGDVASRPLIKATATGGTLSITQSWTDGASSGHTNLSIEGRTAGQVIWIDCESMEIWDETMGNLLTVFASGAFPTLKPGANEITGSGWTELVFQKRERYL